MSAYDCFLASDAARRVVPGRCRIRRFVGRSAIDRTIHWRLTSSVESIRLGVSSRRNGPAPATRGRLPQRPVKVALARRMIADRRAHTLLSHCARSRFVTSTRGHSTSIRFGRCRLDDRPRSESVVAMIGDRRRSLSLSSSNGQLAEEHEAATRVSHVDPRAIRTHTRIDLRSV
jgi:hypothetical protein